MGLSIYEGRRRSDRLVYVPMAINLIFACTCFLWWGTMAVFVAEPLSWATWAPVSAAPDVFEFPFVLMWGLPLAATCLAWLAQKIDTERTAFGFASFPIILIGTMIGWYYLAPKAWH